MTSKYNMMTSYQPATRWEDALPAGNGSLGALVYGSIRDEIIVINHEEIREKSSKPQLESVSQYLPKVREMMLNGNYQEGMQFFQD
ncbi:MAG: glycoside hydrolase N-terminal domain-containing protein, partial [bacterium]